MLEGVSRNFWGGADIPLPVRCLEKDRAVVQWQGKDECFLFFSKKDQWVVPVVGAGCESGGNHGGRGGDIRAVEDP